MSTGAKHRAVGKESSQILDLMHDSSRPSAAIVEFSIAHALQKQGHMDESAEREHSARDRLKSEKARRYCFTGFESYWRDIIVSKFFQSSGSHIDGMYITPPVNALEALMFKSNLRTKFCPNMLLNWRMFSDSAARKV